MGMIFEGWLQFLFVAVPVFYLMFNNDISIFTSEKMPMPSALVWKAVAEVLAKGLSSLATSAQFACLVGAIIGIVCEVLTQKTKGKFPISGVGLGLAFVLQFADSLSMAIGALIFWLARKKFTDKKSLGYRSMVDNQETIAAGVIAGGSIIGIILILLETVVFAQ